MKLFFTRLCACLFICLFLLSNATRANIRYVDSIATGANNGNSWANAYQYLSSAVAAASAATTVDTILIAKGTYYPTGAQNGTNRDSAFALLRGGLKLYGGYPSHGTGSRNITANPTVLSGSIGSSTDSTDNSYHVMVIAGLANSADSVVADGLTITAGNANGAGAKMYNSVTIFQADGGGVLTQTNNGNTKMALRSCTFSANTSNAGSGMYNLHSSPSVSNCTFSANTGGYYGGGMYNDTASSPSVSGCTFSANTAGYYGGGMDNHISSSPSVRSCTFSANMAGYNGGGMYNGHYSSPLVTSSIFSGNSANDGGGIYNDYYSSLTVCNCTFSANTVGNAGGGMYNYTSSPSVSNCILWGNTGTAIYNNGSSPNITYSDVQGGYTGTGNLNADPLFTNSSNPAGPDGIFGTADDGLKVVFCSPILNAGSIYSIPAGTTTDITGAARIQSGIVDMGAYEGAAAPPFTTVYVDSSIAVSGVGNTWQTAKKTLQEALVLANSCSAVTQVWIRKGTYYPTDYPVSSAGGSSSRDYAFALKSNLAIYGGFAGTETAIGQRTIGYPTILSGDIGTPGSNADNCYHVVVAAGCNSTAILDGVTITAAYGNTIGAVTVAGTSLNRNFGGGLCVESSSPVITNCIFQGNATYYTAGGINSIAGGGGLSAGAAGGNSYPSLINCIFYANSASRYGGGVYCATNSSVSLTNCTVYGNSANAGGSGLYCNGGSLQLGNCIIWGNSSNGITNSNFGSVTASYSDVQDVSYSGTNNTISADPLFANTTSPAGADGIWGTGDDGLQPGCGSPAVNTGTASGAPAADLSGNPRPLGGGVDMGAYERYGSVVYVDSSRAVSGNGGSWATAYNTLSAALAAVQPCTDKDSILIAKGTYYPTGMQSGTNRDSAFVILRGGLKLYGGYPTGGGTRNTTVNPTVLSGNINSAGSAADNSYHVVVIAGLPAGADSVVADGLTITSGNASGSGNKIYGSVSLSQNSGGGVVNQSNNGNTKTVLRGCTFLTNTATNGGGMYNVDHSSPAVSNCTFLANTGTNGGGMYNYNASAPLVSYCTFSANSAGNGGGMYNYISSSPVVSNCTFLANTANAGGGINNDDHSSPVVNNCTFSANKSTGYGGGMRNYNLASPVVSNCIFSTNTGIQGGGMSNDGSSSVVINCTFFANTGTYGGGMHNGSGSVPAIKNCIFWGNFATYDRSIENSSSPPTINYNDVQDGYYGTGNLNTDPLFINPASPAGTDGIWGTADDGLQPAYCSPVLNAGSNTGAAATDITGAPRVAFTTVDMGAYEKQTAPPANTADQAALSTASANVLPFVRGCDDGTWTYYAIPGNADSIGFAVAWGNNTAAKAAATVSIKVDGANTVATNATAGTWAMRRYWNVDIGGQSLATPVKVRFYFDNNDALALLQAGAAGGLSPVSSIKWFKTVGTAYSPSQVVPNNINNGNFILLTQVASGIENNTYWVQFDSIVSFSGGTAMVNAGASSALPVTLIDFSAQKSADGRSALLNWDVAGEQGIKTYGVQRSADGISFQTIGAVPATGKSSYSFTDNSPVTGTDYYRLAMIDRDGSYSYSYVRRLEFTQKGSIAISPNPAHNTLTITNTDESLNGTEAVILDFSGRIVNRFTLQPTQTIQLSDWAAGIYLLRLASGEAMKLEKQ